MSAYYLGRLSQTVRRVSDGVLVARYDFDDGCWRTTPAAKAHEVRAVDDSCFGPRVVLNRLEEAQFQAAAKALADMEGGVAHA